MSAFNIFLWAFRALLFCAFAVRGAELDARFLKANGNELRDSSGAGKTVALRGVNLGSWLIYEMWMCPVDSSGLKDDFSAREILANRFGPETARELIATYEESWITEPDFDNIAALGFNAVRLPFWYRTLQTENGGWLTNAFERMDWCVSNAWTRGIRTILDLHGAPGGQIRSQNCGRARNDAELWTSEENIRRTVEIWSRVAGHFRANPAVAAYDLLNEPNEAPTLGALWSVYDRMYRGIRAVDPDHVITVEGCFNGHIGGREISWGWDALPNPDLFGWKNIVYQMHNYEWDWNNLEKQKRSTDYQVAQWKEHRSLGVPCFIGEFNPMAQEEAWRHALKQFDAAGLSWAFWNYKATHGTRSDSWGLYNPCENNLAPNLQKDGAETIRAKWKKLRTEETFALNPMLERAIKASAK